MQIPIEQLLNLPDIQALNVEIIEREIKCDIESTRGYSICHRCGQKATKFLEHGEPLRLRHLPICEKDGYLHLRTKKKPEDLEPEEQKVLELLFKCSRDLRKAFAD
jgi:transposase